MNTTSGLFSQRHQRHCLKYAVSILLLLFLSCSAFAQSGDDDDEDYIDPTRPTIFESATTPRPGVVQLEYGVTSYFGKNSSGQRTGPLGFRFAPNKRIRLDFDLDVFTSERETGERRYTGVGDTGLGFKFIGRTEPKKHAAYAITYSIKLPSASREKGLGSGRVDHNVRFILERTLDKNDFVFNASYLDDGRENESGRLSGAQVVLGYGRDLSKKFTFINEVYGQTIEESSAGARGIYTQSVLVYKVNKRLRLDTGLRFGFGAEAPRVGLVGGLAVGVADLFGRSQ